MAGRKRGPKPGSKKTATAQEAVEFKGEYVPSIGVTARALEIFDENLENVKDVLIKPIDVDIYVQYCETLALIEALRSRAGSEYVVYNSYGNPSVNPIFTLLDKATRLLKDYATALKLTPAARSGRGEVKTPAGSQIPDEVAARRKKLVDKAKGVRSGNSS